MAITNYRTAEGEYLDINKAEDRSWVKSNFPAIMAERPIGMSEGYNFMPTYKAVETLQNDFGARIVSLGQQRSRARDPSGQEHFVRFRVPSLDVSPKAGDSVPELVLFNSHNGRSTIRAYAGLFRFVCANGMVVSSDSIGSFKLRHFGESNRYDAFEELLRNMAEKFKTLDERIKAMQETILTAGQQIQLARIMMKRRNSPKWVDPAMVLMANRPEDLPLEDGRRSLWLTFNVLQENLTNSENVALEGTRKRLRPLTGARPSILVNEAIWSGMEQFVSIRFPEIAIASIEEESEAVLEGKAEEPQENDIPEAELVAEPAHQEEDGQPEEPILRSFEELMSLDSYADMEAITDAEKSALDADQKKKLSSRKSYLKRK